MTGDPESEAHVDLAGAKEPRLERGTNVALVVAATLLVVVLVLSAATLLGVNDTRSSQEVDNARSACRLQVELADSLDRRAERQLSLNVNAALIDLAETQDLSSLSEYPDQGREAALANQATLDAYDAAVRDYLDRLQANDPGVLKDCARLRN